MFFIVYFCHMNDISRTTKVLLPTACFPDAIWMAWLLQSSQPIIELHETYPKQTIRNRYYIATANGPLRLSIPVEKVDGNHTKTKDVKVLYLEDWQTQHLRAILSAYNKSPYFYHYQPSIELFFQQKYSSLLEHNNTSLQLVLRLLKTTKNISFAQNWERRPSDSLDLRMHFSHADYRIKYDYPAYYQVFSDRFGFLVGMSVLDLIFNLGPKSLDFLMNIKLSSYG